MTQDITELCSDPRIPLRGIILEQVNLGKIDLC